MRSLLTFLLLCAYACTNVHAAPPPKYVEWSGMTWRIRDGGGAPCATNQWNTQGVWVDASGWLHLKLSKLPSGQFACAELWAVDQAGAVAPKGFGRYEFDVSGPLGAIDPDVVLGLFMYPLPSVGPDQTNELDIEIARWGHAGRKPLNYTAWYRSQKGRATQSFPIDAATTSAKFVMDWTSSRVKFSSTIPPEDSVTFDEDIAVKPQRLTINLWLFKREAPSDGKEVEFIIKSLKQSPSPP